MSKKKSPWGQIIFTPMEDEESENEIVQLIKRVKELKKKKLEPEEKKSNQEEISRLEKKIYDLVKIKNQAKMFK